MTVLVLKYLPRKYKLDNHSFSHAGTQHIITGTAQGKGTGSPALTDLHRHPFSPYTPSTGTPPIHWMCKMPLGMQVLSTGKVTACSRNVMLFLFLIQIKNPLMDYFSLIYSNTLLTKLTFSPH